MAYLQYRLPDPPARRATLLASFLVIDIVRLVGYLRLGIGGSTTLRTAAGLTPYALLGSVAGSRIYGRALAALTANVTTGPVVAGGDCPIPLEAAEGALDRVARLVGSRLCTRCSLDDGMMRCAGIARTGRARPASAGKPGAAPTFSGADLAGARGIGGSAGSTGRTIGFEL